LAANNLHLNLAFCLLSFPFFPFSLFLLLQSGRQRRKSREQAAFAKQTDALCPCVQPQWKRAT